MTQLPKSEFAQALAAVAAERSITADTIIESIKSAIIAAYRRDAREKGQVVEEEQQFDAELNPDTGEARVFEIVQGGKKDVTPPGFGRIAAQTAKQVIHQKIREAEREVVLSGYENRIGQLVSGIVLRFDGQDVRVDIGKAEAIMPVSERVPSERLESGQRLAFLLKEIRDGLRGRELVVSRTDPMFIHKLFEREVPELAAKSVEVKAIARDPGIRTKFAVASKTSGVDPVGSCVGQKGVRVQAVINEVGGEKIDVIPWTDDVAELITLALAPAQNVSVRVNKEQKTATALVAQDQLSLAIGKDGQNVRLASRLAGYEIEVEAQSLEKIEKKEAVVEDVISKPAVAGDQTQKEDESE